MTFPSEHDFALFLFQLFVLLSVALTLGSFLRRLGQAAVVGEIVAGVLLGPSVLGALGAYLGGMPRPEALAVGFGLNARGAMEIILAFLALEYSLINEKVFVALVITAIVTSMMSGPLIQWVMSERAVLAKTIPIQK